MPNESREERCVQYLEGRLALIQKANGYWNDVALIEGGHLTTEELNGAKSPVFSIAAGQLTTIPEERRAGKDVANFDVTIRASKKLTQALDKRDLRKETSRLVRDIVLAYFYGKAGVESDPGMNCNANTSWISNINRQVDTGLTGWIACEVTFTVEYMLNWMDP